MDFTLIIILLAVFLALAAIFAVIRQMMNASASLNNARTYDGDPDSTEMVVEETGTDLDDQNAYVMQDTHYSGDSGAQGDAIFHAVDTARESVENAVESSYSSSSDSGGSSDSSGGGGSD